MASRKMTEHQKEVLKRRRRVAALKKRGSSNGKISKAVGVSSATVTRDLKWIEANEPDRLKNKTVRNENKDHDDKADSSNVVSDANKRTLDAGTTKDEFSHVSDGKDALRHVRTLPEHVTVNNDDIHEDVSTFETQNDEDAHSNLAALVNVDESVHDGGRSSWNYVKNKISDPEPSDYDDVRVWWDNESTPVDVAAIRGGGFRNASNAEVREAARKAASEAEFDSIPDEDKYRYLKNKVQQGRLEVAIGVTVVLAVLLVFAIAL